jgi:hypothetical protein
MKQTLTKTLLSAFCILNLGTVLYINRPSWVIRSAERWLSHLNPETVHSVRMKEWYVRRYAHLVGLDNLWQMFGRQSRFNWWFQIKGLYKGGKVVLLTLPLQSPRTFVEKSFFDFKEGKYHLNLYAGAELRRWYADYLCREHPTHEGAPIQAISWEMHYQNLLPPQEAKIRKTHLEEKSYSSVWNHFTCPASLN